MEYLFWLLAGATFMRSVNLELRKTFPLRGSTEAPHARSANIFVRYELSVWMLSRTCFQNLSDSERKKPPRQENNPLLIIAWFPVQWIKFWPKYRFVHILGYSVPRDPERSYLHDFLRLWVFDSTPAACRSFRPRTCTFWQYRTLWAFDLSRSVSKGVRSRKLMMLELCWTCLHLCFPKACQHVWPPYLCSLFLIHATYRSSLESPRSMTRVSCLKVTFYEGTVQHLRSRVLQITNDL